MKALLFSPTTGSSELVAAPAAEPVALVASASAPDSAIGQRVGIVGCEVAAAAVHRGVPQVVDSACALGGHRVRPVDGATLQIEVGLSGRRLAQVVGVIGQRAADTQADRER